MSDRGAPCEYLKDVVQAARALSMREPHPASRLACALRRLREADPAVYVATAHPRAGSRRAPHTHQACPRPSVKPVPALRRAGLPAASRLAQTLSFGSIIRSAVDWLTLQRGWRRR